MNILKSACFVLLLKQNLLEPFSENLRWMHKTVEHSTLQFGSKLFYKVQKSCWVRGQMLQIIEWMDGPAKFLF